MIPHLSLFKNRLMKMVLFLRDRLDQTQRVREAQETVLDSKCGQMAVDTKATGKRIKPKAEANSSMWMVMFMMVIGLTIRPMDLEYIHTQTELNMRANGKMINNMVSVLRRSLMVASILVITSLARKKGQDIISGVMEINIMVNGETT